MSLKEQVTEIVRQFGIGTCESKYLVGMEPCFATKSCSGCLASTIVDSLTIDEEKVAEVINRIANGGMGKHNFTGKEIAKEIAKAMPVRIKK